MKRFFRFLPALVAALALGCITAGAAEQELTAQCDIISSQNNADIWTLTDHDRTTRFRTNGETTITISCAQPFSQLYIIWQAPPAPWQLTTAQGSVAQGQNGFLHEYISLDTPQNEVTITVTQEKNDLCDLFVFPQGEPPEWVQRWQLPYEDAELLLLPTHADDEHLYFGGTMPYYAGEQNRKVQVAYLTNHWGEPYRPHELLNGLWKVGVTAYPVMSNFADQYADNLEQAKQLYPEDEVIAFQVELLRRFRPEVVIGHDVNGEYGHGVHIYNTYTLQKALELSNDSAAYPQSAARYGVWEVPKTYLHLYEENAVEMDWEIPLQRFGGKTALEMVKLGYAEHHSQQKYFQVNLNGPYSCKKFGLYRSTVGRDVIGKDFFENIAVVTEAAEEGELVPPPTPPEEVAPPPPAPPVPPAPEESKSAAVAYQQWWLLLPVLPAVLLLIWGIRRTKRNARRKSQ